MFIAAESLYYCMGKLLYKNAVMVTLKRYEKYRGALS